jgi:hypothetical protein
MQQQSSTVPACAVHQCLHNRQLQIKIQQYVLAQFSSGTIAVMQHNQRQHNNSCNEAVHQQRNSRTVPASQQSASAVGAASAVVVSLQHQLNGTCTYGAVQAIAVINAYSRFAVSFWEPVHASPHHVTRRMPQLWAAHSTQEGRQSARPSRSSFTLAQSFHACKRACAASAASQVAAHQLSVCCRTCRAQRPTKRCCLAASPLVCELYVMHPQVCHFQTAAGRPSCGLRHTRMPLHSQGIVMACYTHMCIFPIPPSNPRELRHKPHIIGAGTDRAAESLSLPGKRGSLHSSAMNEM